MMGKYFIFDCDGVLVDTEVQWKIKWFDFLNNNGFPFYEEDFKKFPGGNWPIFYEILSSKYSDFYPSAEKMLEAYREYFKDYVIDYASLAFPQVNELIVGLSERGYRLAVASSSPYEHIEEVTSELGVKEYFEFFISGYDFEQSKPHPEIYLYTAQKFGVPAQQCWVLEDSTYGIIAAKAAEMKVIGRKDERFGFDQSQADYLIDDMLEVLAIVDNEEL